MRFKILLAYIFGYLEIKVEGYFIEKFINNCLKSNIFLWNIKRKRTTIMTCNIGVKDFKNIRKILKQTKCRIKIEKKKGLPFTFNKYRKRKIFALLIFIILIIIAILSNFVWNIQIEGTEKISKDELIQTLKEEGLSIGKFKPGIETREIINKVRLDRDDIAWIGIEITGTNAIVKVVEAEEKPEIVDEDEYCNIVATKDGVVTKIMAQNGTPLVKNGDLIKKGTVLIGGWLEGKYTGTRYVHSNGQVEAKVWYTQKERVYLKETKKEDTGEAQNKYSVNINNFIINFNKRVSKFENYDTIEEAKKIKLFSNFYLPIELVKTTYKEYKVVEIVHTLEEAKTIGIERAKDKLNAQIENTSNITDEQINIKEGTNFIDVEVVYEVKENIGTKEKIVF
ncbi:sporulation protein YqfD [Clostridium sp. CAG:273]|nr:sporulation protein YqfD [Clostridium sp. CAG:273]